jgi:hypothetical protein
VKVGPTTSDAERIKGLEQENRELRRANGDPLAVLGFLRGGARPPTEVAVAFIDQEREEFAAWRLGCSEAGTRRRVFGVGALLGAEVRGASAR